MNQKCCRKDFCCRLLPLLLAMAVCIVGCTANPRTSSRPSSEYETYTASFPNASDIELQAEFDEFTDSLFRKEVVSSTLTLHSLLAEPAAAGISHIPVTYGSASLEDLKADMADTRELQKELERFSPDKLTNEQQLTFQILKDYIETALLSDGLELYDQPLAPTIGVQAQLPVVLAEYAFYSKEDIDTYLSLLSVIDEYYRQIGEFEKARAEAGLFMSDTTADNIITSCEAYLINPEDNFITQTFDERLEAVDGLTDDEKNDYRKRHIQILGEHFVPAYQSLIDTLTSLKGTGTNHQGMCGYPEGKAYYEYLVHGVTGMSYPSIDDLRKTIEAEMKLDTLSIVAEMRKSSDSFSGIEDCAFRFSEPAEIIESLKEEIACDFPSLPECSYTIKDIPKALELSLSPAFYILPPLDRFEENVIYINRNERFEDDPLYPTLAHEGYPGHLYQTVYFINKNQSRLRHLLSFGSYSEGWATYAEFQSYFFNNGLNKSQQVILMHNRSLLLGLHAYLDLQINYYGWTKEDVALFLEKYYSVISDDAVDEIFQTMIENPANYLEYYVGYLEINSMRRKAEEILGEHFHPADFHTFLLDIGPAPFTVIRPHFEQWLVTVQNGVKTGAKTGVKLAYKYDFAPVFTSEEPPMLLE